MTSSVILIKNAPYEITPDEQYAILEYSKKQKLFQLFYPIVLAFYLQNLHNDYSQEERAIAIEKLGIILKNIYVETSEIFGEQKRNQLFNVIRNDLVRNEINLRYVNLLNKDIDLTIKKQLEYIITTFDKDYIKGNLFAEQKFKNTIQEKQEQIQYLQNAITNINDIVKVRLYSNRIKTLQQSISDMIKNKPQYIKIYYSAFISQLFRSRAKLTTMQNIGIAQSLSKAIEAEAITSQEGFISINNQYLMYSNWLSKRWVYILDNRTREAHRIAGGQVVKESDDFRVGGENLKYPRDPNASIHNTANCRCDAIYISILDQIKQ